jgi:lipopolysaccharide export system permease protein
MKIILYRYMLKEQLIPLGVCLFGLSVILVTGRLIQIARYLFTSAVTVGDLAMVIGLAMPKLFLYIFPMAALMGVLLAFVRLNGDNEIVAMRAAGVSFGQFAPPVLAVLALLTSVALFIAISVAPVTNKVFRDKIKSLGQASLPILLKEGTFIDAIPKMVFFFQKVNAADMEIAGVFIRDNRQPNARVAITAESARLYYSSDQSQVVFKIQNGYVTRVGGNLEDAQVVSFKSYDLKIDFEELLGDSSSGDSTRRGEMSLAELRRTIRHHLSAKPPYRYAMEYHQRFALPFGCLFLGLVGAPLGTLSRRWSRMTGVTLGLGIFLAYYVMLSACKGMGENGVISPFFAVWTPNIITALLAAHMWIEMQRESRFVPPFVSRALSSGLEAFRGFHRKLRDSQRKG